MRTEGNHFDATVRCLTTVAIAVGLLGCPGRDESAGPKLWVDVVQKQDSGQVDILVGDRPFTSYLPDDRGSQIARPILYPVWTSFGKLATRGFPIDPRPGERADHPHQVGIWLSHGDIDGFDFWTNELSDHDVPVPPNLGSIRHRSIVDLESGSGRGTLTVMADWLQPDDRVLLEERTRFVFEAEPSLRSIERITTLTAPDDSVTFFDSKEGMVAIRVARSLEQPSDRADSFVMQDGSLSEPRVDNSAATGHYRNSEGDEGDGVWGKRARWSTLSGTVDAEPVTIAFFDHPDNVGHPTHWMARGYGLFSANPLGPSVYTQGAPALDFTLAPGSRVTFRYKILLVSESGISVKWIEARYREFATSK